MKRSGNLVWVDLEMTGLDPRRCAIVEIATIITDSQLEVLGEGPCLVIHQSAEVLAGMNEVVRKMHTRSGLLQRIGESTVTLAEAEEQSLEFVKKFCDPQSAPLCGNSIWKDRQFVERYMPSFDGYLSYRCVDVSSIKELVRRWYPANVVAPDKSEAHRALDDIRESIAELRWYREHVFVTPANAD